MILVADSGSTKCDWILINGLEQVPTKTMGFNPFFHSVEIIGQGLMGNSTLLKFRDQIRAVYYYGAGCSSDERNQIVRNALSSFFVNLNELVVDHDLTGAALATSGGEAGIACILGTGSNSCFFDGEKVHEKVPALGYILGDEGSGSFFGKILLSEYLYKRLPSELSEAFELEYSLAKETIFHNVYNQPNPNVYLASFMKFVSGHRSHPFFKKMMFEGLSKFADVHITCYDQYRSVPVHFVGSIAYYFTDILNEVAENVGFTVGTVIKKPIDSLATFHTLNHENQS